MRFGLELHVVTALDKSAHCRCFPLRRRNDRGKAREKLRKLRQTKMKAKLRGRAKLDEESLAFDERSHLAYGLIADQISAPVLSAPDGSAQGADPLEHCSNGSGSDRTGRTAKSNARPGRSI